MSSSEPRLVDVVVERRGGAGERAFTYVVPEHLRGAIAIGVRVLVPLGKTTATGRVVGIPPEAPPFALKEVISLVGGTQPPPELMRVASWLADHYQAPMAECVRLLSPPGPVAQVQRRYAAKGEPGGALPGVAEQVWRYLRERGRAVSQKTLGLRFGEPALTEALHALAERGLVQESVSVGESHPPQGARRVSLTPSGQEVLEGREQVRLGEKQWAVLRAVKGAGGSMGEDALRRLLGSSVRETVRGLERRGLLVSRQETLVFSPEMLEPRVAAGMIHLTEAQRNALGRVTAALRAGSASRFLLRGVTASGKTEVYLRAAAEALGLNKGVMMLVPEIALTPQAVGQLRERFGPGVAIIHSRLTPAQRGAEWHRLVRGDAQVVVGPRSAALAPVRDLGLVIVDEEHENSYKSERTPRYDARKVVEYRAQQSKAALVMGSATPSVESYHAARQGEMEELLLPERIDGLPLPEVELVDMRRESNENKKRQVSARLQEAVSEALLQGQQVLLFLNRRGYMTHCMCEECGTVLRCPNCSVGLVWHRAAGVLRCHHCGYVDRQWEICPVCKGSSLTFSGTGTQRVESSVAEMFPEAGLLRLDRDAVRRRGALVDSLRAFAEGRAEVLVGTQMIGKGLDFGNVGLVGVVNADTALAFPDFRAGEWTFQMLAQVSGRAGRGPGGGCVVVQTYNPNHYAVQCAAHHDYEGFYAHEIAERKRYRYPPFVSLVNLIVSHRQGPLAQRLVRQWEAHLRKNLPAREVEIVGPAICPLGKLKGHYRFHILLKAQDPSAAAATAAKWVDERPAAERPFFAVDVEPVSLL